MIANKVCISIPHSYHDECVERYEKIGGTKDIAVEEVLLDAIMELIKYGEEAERERSVA